MIQGKGSGIWAQLWVTQTDLSPSFCASALQLTDSDSCICCYFIYVRIIPTKMPSTQLYSYLLCFLLCSVWVDLWSTVVFQIQVYPTFQTPFENENFGSTICMILPQTFCKAISLPQYLHGQSCCYCCQNAKPLVYIPVLYQLGHLQLIWPVFKVIWI